MIANETNGTGAEKEGAVSSERDELLIALNCLFWKVPNIATPGIDAPWWAAELRDKDIDVCWDAKHQQFVRDNDAGATVSDDGR